MSTSLAQRTANVNQGKLEILIRDVDDMPLPCRVHLTDVDQNPIVATGLPNWRGHFVCNGSASVDCPPGRIEYAIERGPEYEPLSGHVLIETDKTTRLSAKLERIADLAEDGWFSGDLHIHRPLEHVRLLMSAEDLDIGPVITWWNRNSLWADKDIPSRLTESFDDGRWINVMAGEDEREGGALLYYHLRAPLGIRDASREYPSPMKFVKQAREIEPDVWIDIEKPFWWDVPVWVASGLVDSIGIANNHMCHSTMLAGEAWGRPRDTDRLPNPLGNGFWTQEIYYHLLNTGIRLPPSAGSASGVLPNPVGYNRVYVQVDGELNYEKWWAGLKAGRSFVTNGPLLRVTANEHLAGHVFEAVSGPGFDIQIAVELNSKDRLSHLEIVQNGDIVQSVKIDAREFSSDLKLRCDSSGWFLVRAFAENRDTFRFASTAPFYVEFGESGDRRVSRRSAEFFVDWVEERIERVTANLEDRQQREDVLEYQLAALQYWRDKVARANAD